MSLYHLNGIGKIRLPFRKDEKKQEERRGLLQKVVETAKIKLPVSVPGRQAAPERKGVKIFRPGSKAGTFKKVVAKVGLAPSRTAFLGAVRINIFGLAKKLAELHAKSPSELILFWEKFGGDWKVLKETIEKGSKQSLGAEPISTSAIVAAATPIVVALISLLKRKGISPGELEGAAEVGKQNLATDEGVELSEQDMSEGGEVGLMTRKPKATTTNLPLVLALAALAGGFFLLRKN